MKRDYYKEIDTALNRYENGLYPTRKISWITDRIVWCYKFRNITEEQMNALCDRSIAVMRSAFFYD